MKKSIGILLLMCIALNAHAQLLWKISGNGLEHPSYLFGTHHLASYSILKEIEGLIPAFEQSTQVIGEIKLSEMQSPSAMQIMQQQMMMGDEKSLKSLFSSDEYQMVNTYVKENMKFDLEQTPKLKPVYISNNIVILLYMKHVPGYNPQEQLDTYFQVQALEKGKKVDALENMEFQVNLLFNSTTVERQAELLACMLNDIDSTLDEAKQLTAAYMAQDLNTLHKLAYKKEGTTCDPLPGEMEALIDKRNMEWVKKLPGMMEQQPSFIAVGALHLPGEKGLINLLKEAGYTIEAVQ